MYKFLILCFIAIFIQFSHAQTADANCTSALNTCQQLINSTVQVNVSKCDQYSAYFKCLQNVTCVSDVHVRLSFLRAGDNVNNATCNITNEVYQPITTAGCPLKKRNCLFSYVDNLVALSKVSNDSEGICLHMSNYAQCLLSDSACANETQVTAMVASEQTRAKINSTSACVIPSLIKRTLTYAECSAASMQCLSIAEFRSNVSDVCPKVRDAFKCVASLNCDNDVMPLVARAYYLHGESMMNYTNTSLAQSNCDTESMFPLNKANLTECERVRKNCTYPYVDLVTIGGDVDVCKSLNSYISCLIKTPTCITLDRLKQLSTDEITRTRIGTCTVTAFNGGEGLAALGWMTMMAILLAFFISN